MVASIGLAMTAISLEDNQKGKIMRGYIGDTKWHFSYWKDREFLIGYRYRGQTEKGNIVTLFPESTPDNFHYWTNDGKPIPKFVYRHLVQILTKGE